MTSPINAILQWLLPRTVEAGESDGWHYKKYQNGDYEAYQVKNVGPVACTGAYISSANIYASGVINPPAIPGGINDINIAVSSVYNSSGAFWLAQVAGAGAVQLIRGGSATLNNVTLKYDLSGKWK